MKKIIIVTVSVLLITGCGSPKLDGKIVKDGEGNLYYLKHSAGKTYFVKKIDRDAVEKLVTFEVPKKPN